MYCPRMRPFEDRKVCSRWLGFSSFLVTSWLILSVYPAMPRFRRWLQSLRNTWALCFHTRQRECYKRPSSGRLAVLISLRISPFFSETKGELPSSQPPWDQISKYRWDRSEMSPATIIENLPPYEYPPQTSEKCESQDHCSLKFGLTLLSSEVGGARSPRHLQALPNRWETGVGWPSP